MASPTEYTMRHWISFMRDLLRTPKDEWTDYEKRKWASLNVKIGQAESRWRQEK